MTLRVALPKLGERRMHACTLPTCRRAEQGEGEFCPSPGGAEPRSGADGPQRRLVHRRASVACGPPLTASVRHRLPIYRSVAGVLGYMESPSH
jgi:hypothetical protein